ncbi:MAG: thiamine-phosphate kinase [Rhodocyclaceae bacterium]|nr:thiamine-phosphate kinase [Rhodocyclaceae bacterium]
MASEFELIDRYFKRPTRHTVLGVGDDAAIVRPTPGMELVISTDMLVAGTHFLPQTDAADLGWKTLAVNVSDMAAMGAAPRWALLAAALPAATESWIAAFAAGFFACADEFGIDVIGGDTTKGPRNFCVTIFGEVPAGQALRRSGAQPGDEVWISGRPGLAALGLAHLQGRCALPETAAPACLSALQRPQPRVALGLALRGVASAAIDVSDGLLADLGHILAESKAAATLHFERLPGDALAFGVATALARDCLLAGGDDYELVFTAPPARHADIEAISRALPLALTCIGSIDGGAPATLRLLDAGQPMDLEHRGFDHFGSGLA